MSPRARLLGLALLATVGCESDSFNEILDGKACTSQGECAGGYRCVQGTCVTTWVFPGEGGSVAIGVGGEAASAVGGSGGEGGENCVIEGNCPPVPLAQGSVCESGSQCLSGSCVDGVCCESACTGSCSACSAQKTGGADGSCLAIGAGADPDGECGAAYMSCDGAGACVCNACSLALGAACIDGAQCTSGNCADGVCCTQACGGECRSCRADDTGEPDGSCAFIEGGLDPDNECPGNKACNGEGECVNCNGNGCDD